MNILKILFKALAATFWFILEAFAQPDTSSKDLNNQLFTDMNNGMYEEK